MIYSHSRLSTFEQCRLKFKYQYLDEREPPGPEQTVEAFMGKLVHETLEKLYEDLQYQEENSLQDLLDFYNELWEKRWSDAIKVVKDYDPDNYREMGEEHIRTYYESHHPFDGARTVSLEERVLIELGDGHKLQGYIDRLAYDPEEDCYEIHDYKTGSYLPPAEQMEADRQLALYSLAVREKYDTDDVRLIWHFLAYDQDIVLEKSEEDLEELKEDTIQLINRIEAADEFPAKPSGLCDYCEFRPICPEWSHLAELEGKEEREWQEDEGVQLVDEYVKLRNEIRELKAEKRQMRKKILQFAEDRDITSVAGSDHRARIYSYDNVKIPDEQQDELEEILKEHGLWEEASQLDRFRLRDILKHYPLSPDGPDHTWDEWPEEVIKKISKMARREERKKIYLNQL